MVPMRAVIFGDSNEKLHLLSEITISMDLCHYRISYTDTDTAAKSEPTIPLKSFHINGPAEERIVQVDIAVDDTT
jgi:hypothetical protein